MCQNHIFQIEKKYEKVTQKFKNLPRISPKMKLRHDCQKSDNKLQQHFLLRRSMQTGCFYFRGFHFSKKHSLQDLILYSEFLHILDMVQVTIPLQPIMCLSDPKTSNIGCQVLLPCLGFVVFLGRNLVQGSNSGSSNRLVAWLGFWLQHDILHVCIPVSADFRLVIQLLARPDGYNTQPGTDQHWFSTKHC